MNLDTSQFVSDFAGKTHLWMLRLVKKTEEKTKYFHSLTVFLKNIFTVIENKQFSDGDAWMTSPEARKTGARGQQPSHPWQDASRRVQHPWVLILSNRGPQPNSRQTWLYSSKCLVNILQMCQGCDSKWKTKWVSEIEVRKPDQS